MKGKTYYTGTSHAHQTHPFASKHPSYRPWKDDTNSPVSVTQILYMWKTSLPHHWKQMPHRPLQHVKGANNNKRDTLEFLRETQQYIDSIRKPMPTSAREVERTISPRQRSSSPKTRPTDTQAEVGEGRIQVGGLMPSRLLRTETLDSPVMSAREAPTTSHTLQRVLTVPSSLIEAGFGTSSDPSCHEEHVVHSYLRPHSLVPLPKRPPKSRQLQRLCALEVQSFMSRFDRKREAEVVPAARKGMQGWKLKLGSKTARPRTETQGSRLEMALEGKQI